MATTSQGPISEEPTLHPETTESRSPLFISPTSWTTAFVRTPTLTLTTSLQGTNFNFKNTFSTTHLPRRSNYINTSRSRWRSTSGLEIKNIPTTPILVVTESTPSQLSTSLNKTFLNSSENDVTEGKFVNESTFCNCLYSKQFCHVLWMRMSALPVSVGSVRQCWNFAWQTVKCQRFIVWDHTKKQQLHIVSSVVDTWHERDSTSLPPEPF